MKNQGTIEDGVISLDEKKVSKPQGRGTGVGVREPGSLSSSGRRGDSGPDRA